MPLGWLWDKITALAEESRAFSTRRRMFSSAAALPPSLRRRQARSFPFRSRQSW